MLRRKKAKSEAPTQVDMPEQSTPSTGSNGYQVVEVPTYHGGKRKVIVYTSDPSGRIIKTVRKR